jgi:ABC-type nitrate/sulfonate/bicarbonate transport system permease component
MKISFTKKQYLGFISVALMLLIWQLLSIYFNSDFIMPSPGKTFMTAIKLFADPDFVSVVGMTILRGMIGFFISAFLGWFLGSWPV